MSLNPSEHTVRELREAVQEITDPDVLTDALEAESQGQNRQSAKTTIQSRLNAVEDDVDSEGPESADTPSEGEEDQQDVEDASDETAEDSASEDEDPGEGDGGSEDSSEEEDAEDGGETVDVPTGNRAHEWERL